MATLKVLLVEDHTLMRQGIKELLSREAGITVVGEVGDGSQTLLAAERLQPDVVLMDLSLPGVDGIKATRQIRERCPAVRVLVLSMHQSKAHVFHALRAGVSGYVLKQSTAAELDVGKPIRKGADIRSNARDRVDGCQSPSRGSSPGL